MAAGKGILSMKASSIVLPVVLVFLLLVFSVEYANLDANTGLIDLQEADNQGGGGGGGGAWQLKMSAPQTLSGEVEENSQVSLMRPDIKLERVVELRATLRWTDEPDATLMTNQPDSLQLSIASPSGATATSQAASNPQGGEGVIELTLNVSAIGGEGGASIDGIGYEAGPWVLTVTAGDCGDQQGFVRTQADTGNAFSVTITYLYFCDSCGGDA